MLSRFFVLHRTVLPVLLSFFLFLSGCQSNPEAEAIGPAPVEREENKATPVASVSEPDPDQIAVVWQSSPHANTFVTGDDGKNSDCARCHAPVEWIPSMDDLPESCYACKFTVEPPPPVISEEQWSHVDCKVCHEVKKDVVSNEYAWLEIAAIGEYSKLDSTTELCLKCHQGVDVAGHTAIELDGVHTEHTCTQCHDAHATTAGCSSSGCHEDVLAADIPGHDVEHGQVACVACHDSSGLDVGVNEDDLWITYLTIEAGGETVTRPFTSHNIALEVSCERCHFTGNEWGLEENID